MFSFEISIFRFDCQGILILNMEVKVEVSVVCCNQTTWDALQEFDYYPRLSGDNVGKAFL